MRSFVTGGSGFIGSSLVRRLLSLDHEVIVFDDFSRGSKERINDIIDKIKIINGDVRDKNQVMKAMKNCDNIFHLAFINGTRFFYEKPGLVLDVGIKGALSTVEASIKHLPEKYILASSSEVYHQPEKIPSDEFEKAIIPDILNPRYSYAGGKLISELLTINYFRDTEIKDLIFRPHNVFGPNMGFEHVIPEIMKKLFHSTNGWNKKECDLVIQGNGTDTRAFCYIEDAVDQIISILNKGKKGNIYHVGMNEERSIIDLIFDIGKILELSISIIPGEKRIGGTSRRCPNIDKVLSLGYNKFDNYFEGLKQTVIWYKEYFNNSNL